MSEINKSEILLNVKDLRVSFFTPAGEVKAVNGISYKLSHGEVMGIVGESGSGKSVEAFSIMGLLQSPGKVIGGEIIFEDENILDYTDDQMINLRGNKVSMIFQNPMTSLNPVYTVGNQLTEAYLAHKKASKIEASERAIKMLTQVGINNPEARMRQYPHELSGGMRQRVMIAMGLICEPKLLIADEPTTALDVTIQAQIVQLMKDIQKETNMAIIFITHNLGVVADICDVVTVMYAGEVVEQALVEDIFYRPVHPYTKGLLRSMPSVDAAEYERLIPIQGTPVDMLEPPVGCHFAPRCEHTMRVCLEEAPGHSQVGEGHIAACWLLQQEDVIRGKSPILREKFQYSSKKEKKKRLEAGKKAEAKALVEDEEVGGNDE